VGKENEAIHIARIHHLIDGVILPIFKDAEKKETIGVVRLKWSFGTGIKPPDVPRHHDLNFLQECVDRIAERIGNLKILEQRALFQAKSRESERKLENMGAYVFLGQHEFGKSVKALSEIVDEMKKSKASTKLAGRASKLVTTFNKHLEFIMDASNVKDAKKEEVRLIDIVDAVFRKNKGAIPLSNRIGQYRIHLVKPEIKDDKEGVKVFAVKTHLEKSLETIVNNAVEAMQLSEKKQQRLLLIEVRRVPKTETRNSRWVWEILVTDNGDGISKEVLASLLNSKEPHPSTKGAGIGLRLAKWMCEYNGGRLEIESTHGIGTTVRMMFDDRKGEET
jgi:signal transduction histidine kinase